MLQVKLQPFGKKGEHHYRFVIMENRTKLTGSPVEYLGSYHAATQKIDIDQPRLDYWLKQGASPTDKVRKLCKIS